MRLSTFIHDTLYEISLGVQLARARAHEFVAIAPLTIDGEKVSEKTYVDFDVAVVVSEGESKTISGDGKAGAEIQVASIIKASVGAGIKRDSDSNTSVEKTHRVSFKVPIYMNAHFRDNPVAAADAKDLLAAHGVTGAS